jgi:DMSO/TMAO reductase YedYZ molybdopterin-dependent catalytic subunit
MPGLWAALAVVVVQRLLHGAFHQATFAPYSAAEWVIRESPGPLATYAIDNFGHNAQRLLGYSLIAVALVVGYAVGRRPAWLLAVAAFLLTLLAAWLDPVSDDVAGALASASTAALTAFLARIAFEPRPAAVPESAAGRAPADPGRRRFLARAGLGVIFVGAGGAALFRAGSSAVPTGDVRADRPVAVPADPAFRAIAGLAPKVSTREEHYTVDIALQDPVIGRSGWRLEIDGAVDNPLSLSLADLQAMPTTERINNLSCISNKVGGHLIGNSRWTGVPLDVLLDTARPRADAVTLVATCEDGYHEAILLDDIRGKDALIAFGMNGELLPQSHGFPARMLFPDHYGMRNVKWLNRIELKTEDEDGYWAERGWDKEAVIRTESRFDVPQDHATVRSPLVCAGIAWAGARGVQAVQVSTDGGETWQDAQLEAVLGALSWRRWQLSLPLPPGEYDLAVRAIDGTGTPQDEEKRDPHPSGASGYHKISVTIAGA